MISVGSVGSDRTEPILDGGARDFARCSIVTPADTEPARELRVYHRVTIRPARVAANARRPMRRSPDRVGYQRIHAPATSPAESRRVRTREVMRPRGVLRQNRFGSDALEELRVEMRSLQWPLTDASPGPPQRVSRSRGCHKSVPASVNSGGTDWTNKHISEALWWDRADVCACLATAFVVRGIGMGLVARYFADFGESRRTGENRALSPTAVGVSAHYRRYSMGDDPADR